jgi:hypothetical protein
MIKILVLGDSHSNIFNYCNIKQKNIIFDVVLVPGATAQGSDNPNSKTDALNIFENKLNNIEVKDYKYIIINLGEVDCGFLIWYRKNKLNISIEEQLKLTTDNLFNFVKSKVLSRFNTSQIIINGSILPTIKDSTDKNFLSGARSEINVSQLDRTILTFRYNDILKEKCAEEGYIYMDINNYILDKKTKIINVIYLNENKYDHHLNNQKTYKLWLNELDKKIK